MDRRWIHRGQDRRASERLAAGLGVSPIAAQLLLNRGLATADGARAFLEPKMRQFHEPSLFREMERAASRVADAVRRREPIMVYGDYDVDGITGTALLSRLLELLGGDVRAFVPERSDGYGMREERVRRAAAEGVKLIVAVDNGTSAFAAALAARECGVDLVIADHHLAEEGPGASEPRRPPCHALLNPNFPGETYPFRGLCGAGVAFKLAWAVAEAASPSRRASPEVRECLLAALSLVAVGTVADVVPLEGENRAIVHYGLRALSRTEEPGLRALVDQCKTEGLVREEDVAFRIAPRINAAGRMGDAKLALELLRERSHERAFALAQKLDEANRRRQSVEKQVLATALERAPAALEAARDRAIVLAEQGWPLGVLGIVCSRLVERFYRPAVLIALDGERGRGSARGVPGVSLPEAFGRCKDRLLGFGGHAAAAGLEIRACEVDAFRAALGEALSSDEGPSDRAPPLTIDLELGLRDLSRTLVNELDRFAPWGRGNEPPLFSASGVALVDSPRVVGRNADHLQLRLRQGDTVLKAIGFGLGARAEPLLSAGQGARLDVAFRPTVSRWMGSETVEVELRDLRIVHPAA